VLTAFIIESKQMLEQDPTDVLVSVAIFAINNMGNVSNLPFVAPDFQPDHTAVSINCLLFASLGTSLFAALASVIALQWVGDYDATIKRAGSSSMNYAKRRQFRMTGIAQWKMSELIAALPLVLHASVALFWAGLTLWIWSVHHIVGYVVAGGTAVAALFYASTTLLAAIDVSVPFRTPLSRGFYWLLGPACHVVYDATRQILLWCKWPAIILVALLGVALAIAAYPLIVAFVFAFTSFFLLTIAIVLASIYILKENWVETRLAPWIETWLSLWKKELKLL
jgi:hypothetical protein